MSQSVSLNPSSWECPRKPHGPVSFSANLLGHAKRRGTKRSTRQRFRLRLVRGRSSLRLGLVNPTLRHSLLDNTEGTVFGKLKIWYCCCPVSEQCVNCHTLQFLERVIHFKLAMMFEMASNNILGLWVPLSILPAISWRDRWKTREDSRDSRHIQVGSIYVCARPWTPPTPRLGLVWGLGWFS